MARRVAQRNSAGDMRSTRVPLAAGNGDTCRAHVPGGLALEGLSLGDLLVAGPGLGALALLGVGHFGSPGVVDAVLSARLGYIVIGFLRVVEVQVGVCRLGHRRTQPPLWEG